MNRNGSKCSSYFLRGFNGSARACASAAASFQFAWSCSPAPAQGRCRCRRLHFREGVFASLKVQGHTVTDVTRDGDIAAATEAAVAVYFVGTSEPLLLPDATCMRFGRLLPQLEGSGRAPRRELLYGTRRGLVCVQGLRLRQVPAHAGPVVCVDLLVPPASLLRVYAVSGGRDGLVCVTDMFDGCRCVAMPGPWLLL